jgi:hypothetical protein
MGQMIILAFKQERGDFTFQHYSAMIERMGAPFKMEIKGHIVTVTEDEKAVMMKDSMLEVIKTTILGEKHDLEEEQQNNTYKKAHTNTAAVPTGRGQNGFGATQFTNE